MSAVLFRCVKILLLAALLSASRYSYADDINAALTEIESTWANIYYAVPVPQQGAAYAQLLEKTAQLDRRYPQATDVMFWQALIKASYAEHQEPFSALNTVQEARDLLVKIIELNPNTLKGAAYVVLGTLYHLTPPWPVAFGDEEEAEKLLQTALKINPNGLDSNFYYARFLLENNKAEQARPYFAKASTAPIRPEQAFADTKLQEEAKYALTHVQDEKSSGKKLPLALQLETPPIK